MDSQVKNIIIHVGTNHLPRDNPKDTAKEICKLLVRIQYQFPNTVIFYSGILPKFGKKSFGDINYINASVFNLCARSQRMHFISHNSFAVNGSLNESFFWKDRIHTNKRGLQQLTFDFIKDVKYRSLLNQ